MYALPWSLTYGGLDTVDVFLALRSKLGKGTGEVTPQDGGGDSSTRGHPEVERKGRDLDVTGGSNSGQVTVTWRHQRRRMATAVLGMTRQ
jgi:hypothetical protein